MKKTIWIYESPDGGGTVFRRPFDNYDMKNKEEINWETKQPTGRMFTQYPFPPDEEFKNKNQLELFDERT